MDINKDIFECAANTLNTSELRSILAEHNISVSMKDKKHEIIEQLLELIDENKMPEELYYSIRTRAFSENDNFYDGFYYKYSDENIDFNYDNFMGFLTQEMESTKKSKHSTNTFKYEIYNEYHDEKMKIIEFTFSKETKNRRYDYIDGDVKSFNERIKADIVINYDDQIVYIKSKNYNNSTAIKFFLEKVINKLRIDKKGNMIKLTSPKFDSQIVNRWSSENKFDVKGISSMTIHMLDLLSEFEIEENKFSSYCMEKIYFDNEVIDTKEKNVVKGSIFFGNDIQECIEISEGIINGKKVNGFELDVEYLHVNEETGAEPEIVQVPITILHDNNNAIRIAISKEIETVEKSVLADLYLCIRQVFLNKVNSKQINNTDAIINFINRAREILKEKGIEGEADLPEAVVL